MKNNIVDFIVVSLLLFLGFLYSIFFKDVYIGKSLLVGVIIFLPLSIYLGVRKDKNWKKILIASLVFGGIYGFFFEFMAEFNNSYKVISPVFPRIFNVLPPDNVLGHMLMALFTYTFYQHFIKYNINQKMTNLIKYAVLIGVIAVGIMLILFFTNPDLILIKYEYAFFGSLALIPIIYLVIRRPWNTPNILKIIPYFFILYFIIEVIAVKLSWWIYPGEYYIGWVNVFNLRFPFEELFFWMIFYAPFLISCYELFLEPKKKLNES